MRGLIRGERAREVRSWLSIDLPAREPLPIEAYLEADQIATRETRGRRGLFPSGLRVDRRVQGETNYQSSGNLNGRGTHV
jgi:hypothetical protein